MPFPKTSLPDHARPSLLDTRSLSTEDILALFSEAERLESLSVRHGNFYDPRSTSGEGSAERSRIVCCLFFEPSTRTRMSFQMAAYRLGHQVLTMDLNASSSISKGESQVDTLLNIAAMNPDVIVTRYGEAPELEKALATLSMPVINAGSGTSAHPTQALLDAFTIYRNCGACRPMSLGGQRVLIVGDIAHSRVARSNFDVLSKLGAEIAVCAPAALLPAASEMPKGTRVFRDLDEALSWPTVYMGLRIQLERHTAAALELGNLNEFHERFGLNRKRLDKLAAQSLVLHPGPINYGVEFSEDVTRDPRSRVLQQVSNGVLIRAVLLERSLNESAPKETAKEAAKENDSPSTGGNA